MELIKSNNSISGAIPKIVETPKHFSLNTQLYNKLSFKPYPMKFFTRPIGQMLSLYTSIDRIAHIYNSTYHTLDSLYNEEHNNINIIQDKSDPDIFYAIRPYNGNSCEGCIIEKCRYDELTMEYTIMNTIDIGSIIEKVRIRAKFLYENDDSIIVFAVGKSLSASSTLSRSVICIINKKTFAINNLINDNEFNAYIVANSSSTLYILRVSSSSTVSKFYINKLNTDTNEYTQIYEYAQTTNTLAKRTMCNPVKIGNDSYMLYTYMEDTVYFYKIMKTSIDTNTDTVITELIDIDLNGFILDISGDLSDRNNLYHTLRLIETNDNMYLSLLIHAQANTTTNNIYKQCLHALIKAENGKFTVVDTTSLIDGCYGSLEYIDAKQQIFFTSNSILFYVFNETEEKMILTHRRTGLYSQIGLDSLNRIILHTQDGSLEIITEGNSSILKADFNKDIYNKDKNNNIETTVEFYAKNFLDEYVDTEVKLTLIGPVVFKQNDSQTLITSSSNEGIKSVPVIITGVGNIEVIITQNT